MIGDDLSQNLNNIYIKTLYFEVLRNFNFQIALRLEYFGKFQLLQVPMT